jgi:Bacterial Ig-like domain (group 2)
MHPTRRLPFLLAVLSALPLQACSRDTSTLEPAAFPTDAVVLTDGFAPGMNFQGFSGSKSDALSIDVTTARRGTSSLKVLIPSPGDPAGGYSGGAFVANVPRDLSGYNALTFWAKASINATLNTAGLGNDNTGNSRFTAEQSGLPLTPAWTKYTIPIPDASKLTLERGMFYFAEGPENNQGYTLWLDDIQFEKVTTISSTRPTIPSSSITAEIGGVARVSGTTVTYNVDGTDRTVSASPNYFTFTSSNPAVATVSATGDITVIGAGTTNITAKLGAVAATGSVAVQAVAAPTAAAPTPTRLAADVISLFSNTYTNVPVDTWSASFDIADVADAKIAGNDVKKYTNLQYAGIEFISQKVNATAMTHLHLDVFVYNDASLKVKLVDFGANNAFGGGDDSESEVSLTRTSTPAIAAGTWASLDIPLANFGGLQSRARLSQIIISGSSATTYLDNVYFYKAPAPPTPTAPTVAAPTPTAAAANVVSLFSNAYTNATIDTWSADWDNADVSDVAIAGNATKRYGNLVFAGIEFTSRPVNAATMTTFHMDLWTPDATTAPALFKIKLVDFGANGIFGGGDDVEHEVTVNRGNTPGFVTGNWIALDIPLTSFTGLTTRANLAQLIISGTLQTVFIDNVYFYRAGAATAPSTGAPVPTYPAANTISLFSNSYTNSPVDTWSADWDSADLTDVQVAGNDTKRYANLVFAGIEFISRQIDASAMTHFRMDIWTPDATAAPAIFKIKLVDFGANGAFGGGDDKEHEITLTAATTPALATGGWVTLDIPLTAFAGLTTKAHLAQLIISGDPKTVYVDNVLLHR